MSTFSRWLRCEGRTAPLRFQRNIALLAFARSAVDLITIVRVPGTDPSIVALGWLNPFVLIDPWMHGTMPLAICASALCFSSGAVWNSVHRARDAGWSHWLGLLAAVPFVHCAASVLFSLVPAKRHSVWDLVG